MKFDPGGISQMNILEYKKYKEKWKKILETQEAILNWRDNDEGCEEQ